MGLVSTQVCVLWFDGLASGVDWLINQDLTTFFSNDSTYQEKLLDITRIDDIFLSSDMRLAELVSLSD